MMVLVLASSNLLLFYMHAFYCFQISDVGVMALSERCSALQELHVSSCYGVTDKSVTALAKQSCELTELDVSWCFYVTDQSIKEFLLPICKLKLLRIKGCAVSTFMFSVLLCRILTAFSLIIIHFKHPHLKVSLQYCAFQ